MRPTGEKESSMSNARPGRLWLLPALAAPAASLALAQMTVTGSVTGTVVDPSGQVVAGARVTLTNEATRDVRRTASSEIGAFSFVAVPPGAYSLKVEQSGFKAAERTGLVLTANERLAVGDIALQLGAVSETVSVELWPHRFKPTALNTPPCSPAGSSRRSQRAGGTSFLYCGPYPACSTRPIKIQWEAATEQVRRASAEPRITPISSPSTASSATIWARQTCSRA